MAGRFRNALRTGLVALALGVGSLSFAGCSEKPKTYSSTEWKRPQEKDIAYFITNNYPNASEKGYLCRKIPMEIYTNGNSELTKALNHANDEPVLVLFYFEEDSCLEKIKPIIKNLSSNQRKFLPFYQIKMESGNFYSQIGEQISFNPTKSQFFIIDHGMRAFILSGGELEKKFNGGKDYSEKQVLDLIKSRTKKRVR